MINEYTVKLARYYDFTQVQLYKDITEMPPIIQKGIKTGLQCEKYDKLISVIWDEDGHGIFIRAFTPIYDVIKIFCIYNELHEITNNEIWNREVL